MAFIGKHKVISSIVLLILCCIFPPLFIVAILFTTAYKVYEFFYYKGANFNALKDRVSNYVADCNNLNQHISDLSQTQPRSNRITYGAATLKDTSSWNFKRKNYQKHGYAANVCNCSLSVCDNARQKPFVYLCKYFNIKADAETLDEYENVLNDLSAVDEGRQALLNEKESILEDVNSDVPWLIRNVGANKLEKRIGFQPIDLSDSHYPRYVFRYISAGGNTSAQCEIVLDIANLNNFVSFLSERIRFKKSVAGQRALMTTALRQKIKERDNFTCKKCGVSIYDEPHLLLEIDHIIPVAKGGLTSEENLQTLCWRCNRSKGAKL